MTTSPFSPAASSKPGADRVRPDARRDYKRFSAVTTRWIDNDVYGHLNNVVYYSLFDTAVNAFLIDVGLLDVLQSPVIGLVAETGCSYFEPLAFPEPVDVGLRAARIGASSVRFELGVFARGADETSARGHFIHVYVDRVSSRPVALPGPLRAALQGIS